MSNYQSPMTEAHKRALIVAYYLSKFDRKGVRALGYDNFAEAFAGLGTRLGVPASTVKHMRDSFDPYCSHVRVGWYQRAILPSRANVIAAYNEVSEEAMRLIAQETLNGDGQSVAAYLAPVALASETEAPVAPENTPHALRQKTGDEAEAFFLEQFPLLNAFQACQREPEDVRKLGVGFDFRAPLEAAPRDYFAIEVKGLRLETGPISITDKEWGVAGVLEHHYYLALVRSLDTVPRVDLIVNPRQALGARATMRTAQSVSVTWSVNV